MTNMITVAPGFQYSINIGYDLWNDDKLSRFIPTKSAFKLLEEILLSTNPSSSDRARVLIGAYGKGKSHIVLMILSILMKRELKLFEKMMPKIRENPRLNQLVQNYYGSNNMILPVVIAGSSTSLTQAFLFSLQRTLSEHNLLDVMPETNYRAAINVIKRWEKEFPETYSKFTDAVNQPVQLLIHRLEEYDFAAYQTFERVYPSLTAGSVFNPFLGFDVVELYESVAKGLKAKGYTGIYVVYDEFSKYLETNIIDASVSDTKMLQDFAEKCARSGELQLHLMLISHKEISNYIDKLPKEKVDGWRGVSERFRHLHMNNSFAQTYEIISSVISHREPLWGKFCTKHSLEFDSLFARYRRHQMFSDAQNEVDMAIKGCFPLHPVSTFILPRLSERVAQSERTLFTFLSAEGTATLSAFLAQYDDSFKLVTPDLIFDYFEQLFKKEVYAGAIHDTYVLTSSILHQLIAGSLESKIVKTISLIYILEQFERLSPTKEQIVGIYSSTYDVDDIENAIRKLIEQEFVIYIKRSNDYLRLKQTSGVDIKQKIRDLMEANSGRIIPRDVLNLTNFNDYMYPSRYNDTREMVRYFAFRFIASSEITENVNWEVKSENIDADGVIYGIIPECEDEIGRLSDIVMDTSRGNERYIFVLPKHFSEVNDIVREYAAVMQLRDKAADDPVLFDEYEVVFEDLQEVIRGFIDAYTHPEGCRSTYIHNGQLLSIHRRSALTELMSQICDEVYSLTPVISNESVNRKEITNIALTSRNKIISALLRAELEPNLGLAGTGQDVSIMRSTLLRTGVWSEIGGIPQINLRPNDPNMRNMLATIEDFVLNAKQRGQVCFGELYERLLSPKYHIGMRKGLIPIYIAAVLHAYRQQTVINDRTGSVQTTADVLVQINVDPYSYSLEYLEWDPEKEHYVSRLAEAFERYVVKQEKSGNSYDYVANAMRRWFMALPKFAKESKSHPTGEKILRRQLDMLKLLRQPISSTDLLFKKLPESFDYHDGFTADVAEEIINAKSTFDGLLDELKCYLVDETRKLFLPMVKTLPAKKPSLASVVSEWCESLDPQSFEQLFSDGTDRFLQHLKSVTNDEETFITRLAKLATGLRLEDWDGKTAESYFESLKRFMKTAKDFHSSIAAEAINATSSYQLIYADAEGNSTTRRFDQIEVSARGKLLFNQIMSSLEAMGHSITEQEKRQVLMEVLKKLC